MDYYDNNVAGSNNLFQVMQMNNVKSLIYSSSATVYGNPLFLPFTENHPTGRNISNPYGRTKYFTEELSKDISNTDPKWKIISLRYFNPTGAHPSGIIGEDPKGIPNNLMPYISQVAVGKLHVLNIYGSNYSTPDGTCIRDFIHITDLAKGHLKALHKMFNSEFEGWKAYNLGTGRGYSVLELVKAFEHASGRKVNYKFTSRRYGDIPISYADARLAENDLDWTAEKDIFEMCRDTWKWQSLNPNGYEIDEI
ncbi:hypothetical protein HHI36_009499 [Cryptolaemus montrouzieri]|uniref:UDP-N-acetylglucosamine 4-epimerase n=1 Tax=Cryptolaemus montrouzieri TaxID=559131 RepID=A0ABD2MG28_9CUCU